MICLCSKSLKFFRTSKKGINSDYFAKIAHKIAKSKYFSNILNHWWGGHPAPPHPFILQNCVSVEEYWAKVDRESCYNAFLLRINVIKIVLLLLLVCKDFSPAFGFLSHVRTRLLNMAWSNLRFNNFFCG